MADNPFAKPEAKPGPDGVWRDYAGRPYVYPPDWEGPIDLAWVKGKSVAGRMAYTRTTTYIDGLDDDTHLKKYDKRNVIIGLDQRPDLMVQAHDVVKLSPAEFYDDKDTKDKLNAIAVQAEEASGAHAKRDRGSAVHKACEIADKAILAGESPGSALWHRDVEPHQCDVAAYLRLTLPLFRVIHIERLTVVDRLKVSGTPDRVAEWIAPVTRVEFKTRKRPAVIKPGDVLITDIKTGRVDFGIGEMSMQLSVYAHGLLYCQETNERSPMPERLRTDVGVIIHAPFGQCDVTLIWLDLAAGWRAVTKLAAGVRAWRNEAKKVSAPFEPLTIPQQIAGALTPKEVENVWRANRDEWRNEEFNPIARARTDYLLALERGNAA